ncbi:serine--tRNA ligase [Enterobacteriaceae endosymbiont of Neohaemonia nigricornis]|uniref:serine--tRNA ligase n=1 Tax=Enterobacteriaceae endosymbiont of Neohaemonia nigricornis TaxID=2675792 RepID=UPI00144930B6|nr:serine--tRNA ligase [Enterobacteriaceae endosymbiont of Neohaemonia nigricornis]QJC30609.1 serine--tRNA ligase [Enterobacteriaceae endosymbiont of Neohaemonia nigricornis]
MLDPHLLRNNTDMISKILEQRNFILDVNCIKKYETKRKLLQKQIEILYAKKKYYMTLFKQSDITHHNQIKDNIKLINYKLSSTKTKLSDLILRISNIYNMIPNIPLNDVPIGRSSKDNKEILKWGKKKKYDFHILDHIELGILNNGMDLKAGVNLSGSKFIVLKGFIAYLHRILIQFMLDIHINKHQYQEFYIPYIVKNEMLYGTGQLPKFSNDLYAIKNNDDLSKHFLIPTAEVPLTNLFANKIIIEKQLPIKLVAHSPCFRVEAGTYGKYNRGLIRTHQFEKVEIVQFVQPQYSLKTLEIMTNHAEQILQLLKLPYRKLLLCTGDMSFASSKTYDLEVWLPSQKKYCEIASCSNMGDFQARRMKTRYKIQKDNSINYIHTLNASGLAIGRTLAAIMENYQLKDGTIQIPKILHNYTNGLKVIKGF